MRAVVAASALLTGCFYVDPIEPRLYYHIVKPDLIYRGGTVTLAAQFDDVENGPGSYDWTVSSCIDFEHAPAGCDLPFYPPPDGPAPDNTGNTVSFTVPPTTTSGVKTRAILVKPNARSDRGAVALSDGNSAFEVGDAPPVVQLTRRLHSLAVGAPIDLFATYSDVDSALDAVALTWTPTGPGPYTLEDLEVPQDPAPSQHRTVGKRLTPGVPGSWAVQVLARDDEGTVATADAALAIVADQPPCLRQWLPIVPPASAALPISDPTVFQVPLVDDDLDAYPPITGASQFGTTAFAWSILPPGAAQRRTLVGATGNAVELDPAAFTPGDVVELRVEIFDRQHTALPCDDAAATCSILSSASCIQRQTWRVEIR